VKPVLVDYYKRGYYDWDYGIFCNTFVHPYQLRQGIWPPSNTIYRAEVDAKPVSILIERRQKADYQAFLQLSRGKPDQARISAAQALEHEPRNESALLLKATAETDLQLYADALHTIDRLLAIYPENEDAMDLTGEIYFAQGDTDRAESVWKSILQNNYKYYHAYVNLSGAAVQEGDEPSAIRWLQRCLGLNPFYKPAVLALARIYAQQGDTTRATRYFERAKSL
jgi:tetratricopeptide (TPR) repeat protein